MERETVIVTVILDGELWRIEVDYRMHLATLDPGWRLSRIAQVSGLGMSYLRVRDDPRRDRAAEAIGDGIRAIMDRKTA